MVMAAVRTSETSVNFNMTTRRYISIIIMNVRFQVLTAASMKFRIIRDVAPCSHVEVGRRFREAYCLRHQGDER
jgi:hypothetical protein